MVRDELESLAKEHPQRFKLHYTLDRPGPEWKYSSGFVNKEMMESHLFHNTNDGKTQTFMCGPPGMIRYACLPNLKEMGFTEQEWFTF